MSRNSSRSSQTLLQSLQLVKAERQEHFEVKSLHQNLRTMLLLGLFAAFVAVTHALRLRIPSRALASVLIGASINAPIDLSPLSLPHTPLIQVAHADFRAAQKRTYFRMVPKIITGRDFYKGELKQAIDKEDWKVVEKAFETYVAKYNPNDPSQVDQTDRYVDNYFLRPMTVFAGSFAERGTSPKTKSMMQQVELFRAALDDLEGCVKDRQEGFFSPVVKAPQGAARKKQVPDMKRSISNIQLTFECRR